MSALSNLRKASFAGNEFPWERITLHSQGRQHVHEFPHAPGGAPEKLGRGLWYITIRANFQDRFPSYPGLYPNTLTRLRQLYESQTTATVVHPTTGEFQGFIAAWRQETDNKLLSGEKVDLEFIEDQRTAFLTQTATSFQVSQMAANQASIDQALDAFKQQLLMTQSDLSVFDAIRATVNAVMAFSDTAGMYGQLLEAKALELAALCQQADSLFSMQSPLALSILDPLHDIWAAAQDTANQLQPAVSEWTVPETMSLAAIATRLYGDASRQSDLMSLNADKIRDPYAVPAGTDLQYFAN